MAVLPKGDPGRARTCTTPIKSRPLYRIELRSQRCGRQESNLQRPAFQAGALPIWSYDHASGRGWNRTSDLLFVRQALGLSELLARADEKWAELESNQPPPPYQRGARPTELPAHVKASGRGFEPRSPRSERDVLPLDDPESSFLRSMSRTGLSRTMFSMPLAYPSTLDRRLSVAERRPTWRSFGARSVLAG